MRNQKLVQIFDSLADYYFMLNDRVRCNAFRASARNVEVLGFDINTSTLQHADLKGFGKASKEVIHEFTRTQRNDRLEELKLKVPPIIALQLLDLYNFDLKYLNELWTNYKVASIPDLWKIQAKEPRAAIALDHLGSLDTNFYEFKQATYNILGDFCQTAFGAGKYPLQNIVADYVDRNYKHIFVADYMSSPSVLAGIAPDRLAEQREVIRKAQIESNVRIWQGAVIDVDENGKLYHTVETYQPLDFIILKLSTAPHYNTLQRLSAALEVLPNTKKILVDCLDKYSSFVFLVEELRSFLQKYSVTLILSSKDFITASRIKDFIGDLSSFRIALGTYAQSDLDYDYINLLQDMAAELKVPEHNLMNSLARPMLSTIEYKSLTGVREAPKKQSKDDSIKRLESMLDKFQSIQTSRSLGGLFKKGD